MSDSVQYEQAQRQRVEASAAYLMCALVQSAQLRAMASTAVLDTVRSELEERRTTLVIGHWPELSPDAVKINVAILDAARAMLEVRP